MNKLASLSLIAAAALSLAPKPAKAGDTEAAVIGGLIGGLIIGAAVSDHGHTNVSYTTPVAYCPPAPVIVDNCDTGYWNDVRVQVLVPGCWSVRYDHGRQVRYFAPSHYEWRTNRVWVANNNRYTNHGRQVSSGYGHNNDRGNSRDNHGRDNRGRDDRRNH